MAALSLDLFASRESRLPRVIPAGAVRAVDLFAGWGGFTTGAEQAGVSVVWAANHWRVAVDTHAANHPDVEHVCQDLRQADWTALPRYDLLLASPACQAHSTASQPCRRPYHDAMRATAWAVVDCADATNPKAVVVENVPSFREWRLYPQWRESLRALGYQISENIVRASTLGVPQRRDRLFIVATRKQFRLELSELPEPPFAPCIEQGAGGWRPVASCKQPGARARLEAARARFSRSLVQHVTGHRGISLDEPIRTITTKDQWVIVEGDSYRPLTGREYARGMGFPESYRWDHRQPRATVIKGLGNAVCPPVAKAVVERVADAA